MNENIILISNCKKAWFGVKNLKVKKIKSVHALNNNNKNRIVFIRKLYPVDYLFLESKFDWSSQKTLKIIHESQSCWVRIFI